MSASVGSIPLTLAERNRRNERKARFNSTPLVRSPTTPNTPNTQDLLLQPLVSSRKKRALNEVATESSVSISSSQSTIPFVGTNQSLEKSYLRLTTFPRAELVRPLPVLEQALKHIKLRYLQTEDFEWCNEQLKSIRQDLTVQAIRTPFVLNVYETHARILLEHGDLDEFNQCQCNIRQYTSSSAARALSDDVLAQRETKPSRSRRNNATDSMAPLQQSEQSAREFRSYAVLYSLIRHAATDLKLQLQKRPVPSARALKNNTTSKERRRHKKSRKESPLSHEASNGESVVDSTSGSEMSCEDHALSVVQAVQHVNPVAFFQLYNSAPHMSAYLMDFLVQRVRTTAYAAIVASYRPDVSMDWLQKRLNFADASETMRFLRSQHAVVAEDTVDCLKSSAVLASQPKS